MCVSLGNFLSTAFGTLLVKKQKNRESKFETRLGATSETAFGGFSGTDIETALGGKR